MAQNKTKTQMYDWIKETRNYIGGKCPHECEYCYVPSLGKRFANTRERYSGSPSLLQQELRKNEGHGKMIFVQSCGDLFARAIPDEYITSVLVHCCDYPENIYLLQSKNPIRFLEYIGQFPAQVLFGTTIESNRDYDLSKAPNIQSRVQGIKTMREKGFNVMVSVEPVLDFDLDPFIDMLKSIAPNFISIGADSKRHGLLEPSAEKVAVLLEAIEGFTELRVKKNLGRILEV